MNYEIYCSNNSWSDEAIKNIVKYQKKMDEDKQSGKLEDVEKIKMNLWIYATISDCLQEYRRQIMNGNPKYLCVYDDGVVYTFDKYEALSTLNRFISNYFEQYNAEDND